MKQEKEGILATIKKHNFLVLFSVTFCCVFIYMVVQFVKDAGILGADTNAAKESVTEKTQEATTTAQEEETEAEGYSFENVDLSYLDDAVFIGDSRTLLLQEYAHWENVDFYVGTGFQIWSVMDSEIKLSDGQKMTVREALTENKFKKVYIQLGVNELGRGTAESFTRQYISVLDEIRKLQPDSIIFLQSIMHVSQKQDDKGNYINNAIIDERNAELQKLADNKTIFWLDANSVFDEGDTGKLNSEYTSDGVHLKASCVKDWEKFLLEHGIIR